MDSHNYNSTTSTRTIDGKTIYANNYEYSDIRKWLNDEFLNQAFTRELKSYINTTHVDNSLESTGYTENKYICNDTYDKVYLLSYSEMINTNYGYSSGSGSSSFRQKQLTDYAKARGCLVETHDVYYNNGSYWLRSPNNNLDSFERVTMQVVESHGEINNSRLVNSVYVGIVPGITITINQDATKYRESDWIIDVDATCTETGSKHIECIMCGKILITEEIEALGHNYVNGVCIRCGDEKEDKKDIKIEGNYIYFGEYPQTLKKKSVTITSDTPDDNGYYLGSDGERYIKVEATPCSYEKMYFNNKTIINSGTTYYFKIEPIKWQILEEDNGTYKLVSDLILDNQMFNASSDTRTIDGKTIYPNNYEYSDIRKWLNEEFLNQAFTTELQQYINTTHIDNSLESTGYTENEYICNDTNDKVYLLSYSEMINTSYGYSSEKNKEDKARQKQLTDYAKAKGCSMGNTPLYYNNGLYWLRSPYDCFGGHARSADFDGTIRAWEWVNSDSVGVVVAITVTI